MHIYNVLKRSLAASNSTTILSTSRYNSQVIKMYLEM